jgi:hypothetical protein
VLAGLLVVLAAGCAGGAEERLTLPPGQSFAATGSITPETSAFGDELTARIRVLLDRDRIDPDSIRVLARFSPYRDRTTVERVDSGNLTALLYTYRLLCLTISCVPPAGDEILEGAFTIQWAARVTSDQGPVLELPFDEIRVVPRVLPTDQPAENTGEVEQWPPAWRASVSLPEPTYRLSPSLLTWVPAVLGLLLVAASAAAGWRLLRRGRLFREPDTAPLERALGLLRNARTDEERRAALEALALALDTELDPELAEPARALAWSQSTPSETDAEELATLAEGGSR